MASMLLLRSLHMTITLSARPCSHTLISKVLSVCILFVNIAVLLVFLWFIVKEQGKHNMLPCGGKQPSGINASLDEDHVEVEFSTTSIILTPHKQKNDTERAENLKNAVAAQQNALSDHVTEPPKDTVCVLRL